MAFISALILTFMSGGVLGDTTDSLLEFAIRGAMALTLEKFADKYPDLALSVAFKRGSSNISLAVGKVSGQSVTPQDTFLYGSGTKPITAAAILRLIDDGKLKGTDKVSTIVDPYLKAHGKPALAQFFGASINDATVLDLIRMSAGIRDYEDSYVLDQQTLQKGSNFWDIPYEAMNFSVSAANIKAGSKYPGVGNGPLYCAPGTCTAYSSTSYQVAGLVLVAILQPEREWYNFNLGSALFDNHDEYASVSFPPKAHRPGLIANLSKYLTTPGSSIAPTWPNATIFEQNPSILGWTCGNMVASPRDVAKFYYNLLHSGAAQPLISDKSKAEMMNFTKLSRGWCAGYMEYGAGLMKLQYGYGHKKSHCSWSRG
jgi:CubicO group peptidase (beta-lactamase class C family)